MKSILRVTVPLRFIVFFILTSTLHARVLEVGPGAAYARLSTAAADAQPGDTIMFLAGTHAGGEYVEQLQGAAGRWITISGPTEGEARIVGGGNAFQLSDPAYLRITRLVFEGQTGNGLNIDDGGSVDTPVRHLIIEHCSWLGMNATGNNDELKMSGVDSFTVRHCSFRNGSPGGSLIDMVGCHYGVFENNTFLNGGSNCIQAKGGTHDIIIRRNTFHNGGQRAINIGGSTGLAYFRPRDANFEASAISVQSNVFTGATAPVAYVGAVHCEVVNNTMYLPEKWALRILQENTDARFLQCGENSFENNIVYIDTRAASPTLNIGPNTRPQSFRFANNLWYNTSDPLWGGPNLPAGEHNGLIRVDPLLADPPSEDFHLLPGSPAIGAGKPHSMPLKDFDDVTFADPPSIGAFEGHRTSSTQQPPLPARLQLHVYPHPVRAAATMQMTVHARGYYTIELIDIMGRNLHSSRRELSAGMHELPLQLPVRQSGRYFLCLRGSDGSRALRHILVLR